MNYRTSSRFSGIKLSSNFIQTINSKMTESSKTIKTNSAKISESNSILSPITPFQKNGYKINFLVKPGAKESRVTNFDKECIGLQIAAQPRDGKANKEIISFLSEVLQLRKSYISLISGMKSFKKVVKIEGAEGLTSNQILSLLESNILNKKN